MTDSDTFSAELRGLREDMAEIRHGVKNIQASQTLIAERLTRLEERHDNQKSAIDRAFSEIKDHSLRVQKLEIEGPDSREMLARLDIAEKCIEKVDGEQKKWFNRICGAATGFTLLWSLGGWYVVTKVGKAGEALEAVPFLAAKQKRQDAINRIILKKIGSDIDIVE